LSPQNRRSILAASLLLALMFGLNLFGTRHKTVTYDEPAHMRYGMKVLLGDAARFDDSKMPVTALNMALVRARQKIDPGIAGHFPLMLSTARMMTMLASVLLGLAVFWWSRSLYGNAAGIFSLVLFILSPNLQAHARWVTTDLYGALGFTAALFFFWRWTERPSAGRLIACGLGLGFAQLCKITCVYLYPLFALIAAVRFFAELSRVETARRRKFVWENLTRFFRISAVLLLLSLAVASAGFLFEGCGMPLGAYAFRSKLFQALQSGLPVIRDLPLLLPRPWVEAFDWTRFNEVTGEYRGPAYLFGQLRREPFFWFYPVNVLFKVPVALQVFFVWACVHFGCNRTRFRFVQNELFLIVPILFFAVYFQFLCKAQMGIRHMLVFFPLVHVFCGSLLAQALPAGRKKMVAAGALVLYLAVSVLSYYPHYLSYFNELAGDRKKAYRILADSNLDWGQNEWYADRYVRKHPGTLKNPQSPTFGRVMVSANFLTGIVMPTEYAWFKWVRENLDPVDHAAYSYLVYDVPPRVLEEADEYFGGALSKE